ncbi:MAG: glycosyltransferase family 4 protein [Candidatus Saccharimonadales bacterium]
MARIVIDARKSGTSTGRYVDKLIENLHELQPELEILLLSKAARMDYLQHLAPKFKVVKSDYREFGFGEQIGLLRQIRKLKPDLVHFGMTQQPVLYKKPKITTIHDLTTIRFSNPSKNQLLFKFKQRVYKVVIKSVARKSRYIITPSQFVKQDVAQYAKISPDKVLVTYEAADRISAAPTLIPRLAGQQYIMYVGRAQPHKNLARLVRAFELLKQKKYPDLMLVLAGKSDTNYKRIGALVTERRLAASVIFTDFVSEGELRWLYENTAAYVFPSLSEGFGLPGLEAMIHGAPVVASKATCLPEVYGDAAHYFDPRSVSDMASKINDVLSKPSLRTSLIHKGRARAVKFSWRRMAQQTLKIYEQTLK